MFGRGTDRLEGLLLALGVRAFCILGADGLIVESLLLGAWPGRRTEYGPAVAGLAISGRLNFVGRIGATDKPPCVFTAGSGRCFDEAASVFVDIVEEVETVRTGVKEDIAEPGRAGKFLVAMVAFFCASMVSLREGFGGPFVLFEKPKPGRGLLASTFGGEFGLSGACSRSLCCVASRALMILRRLAKSRCILIDARYLSAFEGQIRANDQYVDRMFSRTPGLASASPFLIHFSASSRPPVCSTWLL